MAVIRKNAGNSGAEDRFIEIFCDTFGAEKGQYVYLQYPMVDIYGGHAGNERRCGRLTIAL